MKIIKQTLLASIALISVSTINAEPQSLQESWYIGGALGQSSLNPDGGSHWKVSDDKSTAKKLYTGVNINRNAGIEAFWTDLGDASLRSDDAKSGRVNYEAIGVAGVYRPPINIAGVRPLGKLGIAKFTTKDKGAVKSKQAHGSSVFLGLGAEYPITQNINLRAEYDRYDKDIQQYNLGLNWRPLQRNHSRLIQNKPTPAPVYVPEYVPPAPVVRKPAPVVRTVVKPKVKPKPVPAPRYIPPVVQKPKIQLMHISLSGGSNFDTGSATLTQRGKDELYNLAGKLTAKGMRVKGIHIVGHTDNVGRADANMALSLARANAVANYLQQLGVRRDLMRVDGRGESNPIFSNKTASGRAKNRRVDISIKGVRTIIK